MITQVNTSGIKPLATKAHTELAGLVPYLVKLPTPFPITFESQIET